MAAQDTFSVLRRDEISVVSSFLTLQDSLALSLVSRDRRAHMFSHTMRNHWHSFAMIHDGLSFEAESHAVQLRPLNDLRRWISTDLELDAPPTIASFANAPPELRHIRNLLVRGDWVAADNNVISQLLLVPYMAMIRGFMADRMPGNAAVTVHQALQQNQAAARSLEWLRVYLAHDGDQQNAAHAHQAITQAGAWGDTTAALAPSLIRLQLESPDDTLMQVCIGSCIARLQQQQQQQQQQLFPLLHLELLHARFIPGALEQLLEFFPQLQCLKLIEVVFTAGLHFLIPVGGLPQLRLLSLSDDESGILLLRAFTPNPTHLPQLQELRWHVALSNPNLDVNRSRSVLFAFIRARPGVTAVIELHAQAPLSAQLQAIQQRFAFLARARPGRIRVIPGDPHA
jgi:hypothetical protein